MRFLRDLTLAVSVSLVIIFANYQYQDYRDAKREEEAVQSAEAVGRALQVSAEKLEATRRRAIGCPAMLNGRPLTRSIYRESDVQEPALVCFFATDSQMQSKR